MESRLPRIFPHPRRALTAFGTAVLVGGALMGIGGDESAVSLAYAAVRQGNISATVGAAGTVRSGRIREIGFSAAGTVTKVNVRNGQTVKAGDVLAELDNTQAAEAVTADVAALAAANEAAANFGTASPSASPGASSGANSGSGQKTPSRNPGGGPPASPPATGPSPTVTPSQHHTPKPPTTGSPTPAPTRKSPTPGTSHSRSVSPSPVRTGGGGKPGGGGSGGTGGGGAVTTQQQADANVLKAQVALDQARRTLAGTQIIAPTAGTVLSVAGTVGTVVNGPGSSGFVTIGNLDELQVQADFSESDVAKLKLGQPATVTLAAGNGGPFDGTVAHIEPAATTSGTLVQYGVMISFDRPPGHLLIGQTATVQVTTAQATDSLYIPSRALHPAPTGGYTVLVKRGGATRNRTVRIGIRGDQYVEIRSGLAAGDRVQLT